MKKLNRIFVLMAAVVMIAVALVLSACGTQNDNGSDTEGDLVYVSNNSLYQYTLDENNHATLISYAGTEANVVINRIDGRYAVVKIAEGAFAGNTAIETVEIYASVTTIGEGAFYGCTSLENVTLRPGSALETIEARAFAGCTKLESFVIPQRSKPSAPRHFTAAQRRLLIFPRRPGLPLSAIMRSPSAEQAPPRP